MESKTLKNDDKAMVKTDEETITLPMFKILWVNQEERIVRMTGETVNKLASKDTSKLPLVIQSSMLNISEENNISAMRLSDVFKRYDLIVLPPFLKEKAGFLVNYFDFPKGMFFFLSDKVSRTTCYNTLWGYMHKVYNHINLFFKREPALPIEKVTLN